MYRALIPGPVPHFLAKSRPVVIPSCPGCGDEHAIPDTFGRERRPGEDVDVNLTGQFVPAAPETPPVVPPRTTHDRGTKVPDADLLAAIPTDHEAPAAAIARALGLTHTHTMIERIDRVNLRALAAWGQQLVRITQEDTGRRRMFLKRVPAPVKSSHD